MATTTDLQGAATGTLGEGGSGKVPERCRRWRALWRVPFIARLLARPPRLPGPDERIPQDTRVTTGVLPCGVNYVVAVNRKPRRRALLRLVVRIGSLAEEDKEIGLAHLLEHLVFRGTPSFPSGDLRKFMERCGMTWGADLNAETGMEQTTYSLEVPLKGGSTKLLETGLKVLREFAFDALLRQEDLDSERAVVEAEWRHRLGVEQRIEERFWGEVFAGCRHASRLPMGSMAALQALSALDVRAFYESCYTPERMTVICAGDFPSNATALKMLSSTFADASRRPSAAPARALPELQLRPVPRAVLVYQDEELTQCSVRLRIFSEDHPRETPRHVAEDVSRDLLLLALNRRLTALQARTPAPFVAASASVEHLSQRCRCVSLSASVLRGGVRSALCALGESAASLARHGLSPPELEVTKRITNNALDSAWAERHHTETEDVLEAAEEYALTHGRSRLLSEALDVRLQREALASVSDPACGGSAGLHRQALALLDFASGAWCVEAEVLGKPGDAPEAEASELRDSVSALETADVLPFAWQEGETLDLQSAEAPDDETPAPNISVEAEAALEDGPAEMVHWTLAGGATVTLVWTDFEPDEILVQGFALGGTSELDCAVERTAASAVTSMRLLCGLGKLTKSQLGDYLADKNASMLPAATGYCRYLSGRCGASVRDLEVALRLACWHFAPPNFTEGSLAKIVDVLRQGIENRERDPEHHLRKKLQELTCGSDPFFQDLSIEDLEGLQSAGLEGLGRIYRRFFSDPREWSWTFVGALPDESVCRDLITRFLVPVGAMEEAQAWLHNPVPRPVIPRFSAGHRALVFHGLAEHADVCCCFAVDPAVLPGPMERLTGHCVAEALEARLVQRLREEMGQSYTVSCSVSAGSLEMQVGDRRPVASLLFGCEPGASERCTEAALSAARCLASGEEPLTQEEVESCREKEFERLRVDERENSSWLGRADLALRLLRCGVPDGASEMPLKPPARSVAAGDLGAQFRVRIRSAERIAALSQPDMQALAQRLFQADALVVVTLLPERWRGEGQEEHKEASAAKRPRLAP